MRFQKINKTFKVCKHAIGGVFSRGHGLDRKAGNHILLDIFFQIFTHQQSLHFGENYENLIEKLTGHSSDNVNIR